MTLATNTPKADAFHEHLTKCKQCMDHPFDLCAKGDRLLEAAGTEASELLDPSLAAAAPPSPEKHGASS